MRNPEYVLKVLRSLETLTGMVDALDDQYSEDTHPGGGAWTGEQIRQLIQTTVIGYWALMEACDHEQIKVCVNIDKVVTRYKLNEAKM